MQVAIENSLLRSTRTNKIKTSQSRLFLHVPITAIKSGMKRTSYSRLWCLTHRLPCLTRRTEKDSSHLVVSLTTSSPSQPIIILTFSGRISKWQTKWTKWFQTIAHHIRLVRDIPINAVELCRRLLQFQRSIMWVSTKKMLSTWLTSMARSARVEL